MSSTGPHAAELAFYLRGCHLALASATRCAARSSARALLGWEDRGDLSRACNELWPPLPPPPLPPPAAFQTGERRSNRPVSSTGSARPALPLRRGALVRRGAPGVSEEVVLHPAEELRRRELEVVARRALVEDLARLVSRLEAKAVGGVPASRVHDRGRGVPMTTGKMRERSSARWCA